MFKTITFFDAGFRNTLKPLTFTKPVSEIRAGIQTFREKWELIFDVKTSWDAHEYLKDKFPDRPEPETLYLYGGCLPTPELIVQIKALNPGDSIWYDDRLMALFGNPFEWLDFKNSGQTKGKRFLLDGEPHVLKYPYQLLGWNQNEIKADFKRLTANRKSAVVSDSVRFIGDQYDKEGNPQFFMEEGAVAEYITVNLKKGPVYIGKDAEVMEGSHLRGPVAICDHATINMGTRIYSSSTIGPWCKVGGELSNVIFTGYSNKGHEGFLGDSIIGEWCNIGADSNNSNLKNDYSEVKLWDYATQRFLKTGRQFCGLIMGDHTKCGINTMFNTGTVAGVAANVAVSGFPRNFVPSYTLTTAKGVEKVKLETVFQIAERVMSRRNITLTDIDKAILKAVFDETEQFRSRL
ncbi:putative sugar nucleotidyl transferase [Saccharicrinis sp. FJH62]|uniref:putative sugar nucleotidyl transferase n=1 Tax=Saccharicrinis sp. FJH62 TaxID=3344657 RepID=UPI0035D51035